MQVKEIYDYIDKIAPFKTAVKYDNSGIQIGDKKTEVNSVMFAIDITHDVIDEAVEKQCELIITHHPVIFEPLYNVKKGSVVYRLIENNLCVISAHTNLDMAKGGVTDIMLDMLGLTGTEVLEVIYEEKKTVTGFGKVCDLDKVMSVEELCELTKTAFGVKCLRYTDSGKQIERVAVCSGAGGSNIGLAIEKGCDAYITGDVKHSQFIEAKNKGLTLIDAGHFYTESIFAHSLFKFMKVHFPKLRLIVADSNSDPVNYMF